jgi:hypothetical protein
VGPNWEALVGQVAAMSQSDLNKEIMSAMKDGPTKQAAFQDAAATLT